MVKLCQECNTLNDDGAEYCKNCGINLVPVKDEQTGLMGNELFQFLLCWKDEISGFRFAKTKIAFWIVFLIFFTYLMYFYLVISAGEYDIFISILAGIIVALIFSVPVFAVAFIFHKLL